MYMTKFRILLFNYFSCKKIGVSGRVTFLLPFSFVLCLGQLGPTTDNRTGKNIRELSKPRLINMRIDLKNVLNMYDLQKPKRHMPTIVEIAELNIGKPTRVIALYARLLRSPLPTLAKNACTI